MSLLTDSSSLAITVIVPVHNGGELFRSCLHHLSNLEPSPHELIVVADGDMDGSRQVAKEFGAEIITCPFPRGPAAARNLGSYHAKGDILFFVDADVVLPSNALEQVNAIFQHDSEVDALIGSYDDAPSAPNFLSQYKNLMHHFIHQTSQEQASTFWGACGAIKRDVFLAIGGFDETYIRPSVEDIELGYRLKRSGKNIRLSKELQVKHLKRWTPQSLIRTDIFQRALPWAKLLLHEGQITNDLNLQPSSRVSVVFAYGILGHFPLSVLDPRALISFAVFGTVYLLLNAPLYRFFIEKRGVQFGLLAILWHWFYYLYSGLAFMYVYSLHLLNLYLPSIEKLIYNATGKRIFDVK